ncbi:integrase arm-type DNA-binding domain-containing protein [Gilliamella apicola]|uniref:integrase arm-type DNA-binding domain-containing protein n=1 Tax=Gilliamella apicola TaxID=1196095 RepID=UPI001FD23352|nr:integrase arm-type DNA-binding domain-containing protein [Gilliamella apicola]
MKAAKQRDKDYSLFDGGGMYLLIKANNYKIWRFKYTRPYTKKGELLSFESYPEVSLQQARK